jgi:hypothetical protein
MKVSTLFFAKKSLDFLVFLKKLPNDMGEILAKKKLVG